MASRNSELSISLKLEEGAPHGCHKLVVLGSRPYCPTKMSFGKAFIICAGAHDNAVVDDHVMPEQLWIDGGRKLEEKEVRDRGI
jgi:hypothetical protein